MGETYDVIVAGVGGMGSQTCWQLASRGKRVLGLERHALDHAKGSSHGEHRIIRLAYFEHPLYVPLLKRAYALWRMLEMAAGERLLHITGSMDMGEAGSAVVAGSLASCEEHGLAHELLSAHEVARRYPGVSLPPSYQAVFQGDGGFLASERCILHSARLALEQGAVIRAHEPMLDVTPLAGGGVRVRTTRGIYEAGALVIAAGAWIGELVPQLKRLAVPERQVIGWFRPTLPDLFRMGAFPVSNLKCDLGHFYQFPIYEVPGMKIGLYHHLKEEGEAEALSREVTPGDEALLREGLRRFFPKANGEVLGLRVCLFTNAPDEHFIVDRVPGHADVIAASPCSGHGFKFASVMGEILADMALGQTPSFDLTPFSLSRFS